MLAYKNFVLIFLSLFFASWAWSQEPRPLSAVDIEGLLKAGVTSKRLAALVEERGINFDVTEEVRGRLKRAGAGTQVLDAVEKSSERRLPPVAEISIKLKRTIRPGGFTRDFRASLDGHRIATVDLGVATADSGIKMWNAETGELEQHLRSSTRGLQGAYSVAISPGGKTVAQGGFRRVGLWDMNTVREKLVFEAHRSFITSMAFSRDGYMLATAGNGNNWDDYGSDRALRLWDPKDVHAGRRTLDKDGTEDIEFSPDAKLIAGLNYAGVVVWDVASGARRWRRGLIRAPDPAAGPARAFSPDGRMLVAADQHSISLLEATSGTILREIYLQNGRFSAVAISPSGRVLATGQENGSIRFWNTRSGEEIKAGGYADFGVEAHKGAVTRLWFSEDGNTLISGSFHYYPGRSDKTVHVWTISIRPR